MAKQRKSQRALHIEQCSCYNVTMERIYIITISIFGRTYKYRLEVNLPTIGWK